MFSIRFSAISIVFGLLVGCPPSANAVEVYAQAQKRLRSSLRQNHGKKSGEPETDDYDDDDTDDDTENDMGDKVTTFNSVSSDSDAETPEEKAEEARLELGVSTAQQALNGTKQKMADIQTLKANLQNTHASDMQIDASVRLVANETQSEATAGMLGKMWKEMRMFEAPGYIKYADKKLQKLQVQAAFQEQQLSAAEAALTAYDNDGPAPSIPVAQQLAAPAPGPTLSIPLLAPAPATSVNQANIEKKIDAWVTDHVGLVSTWFVLLLVSVIGAVVMRGKAWKPKRRVPYVAALIILWTIVLFATAFYKLSAHDWTWLECIYFCIVTVTTVGYGDYVPHYSVLDKVLLVCFLWFNSLVLSVVLGMVVSTADDEIEAEIGKSRLLKVHELRVYSVIIAGMVLFGTFLFMYLENWTFLQGITFTTVTLTTVGYGYLLPDNGPAAMIAASVFILIGVPMCGCFVGKLGTYIDEVFQAKKKTLSSIQQLCIYVGLIIGWLFAGAVLFFVCNGHGWNFTECLYLAAVTMTTVGYGDYVPENTIADHIVTIFYIWGSVCVIATVFSDLDGLLLNLVTKGMHRHKDLAFRVGLLGLLAMIGSVAFNILENWGILDSIVYTSVTCTTVGYGHYTPSHGNAMLFAVGFILIGVPLTGSLVGNISSQYGDEIQMLVGKM